MLTALLLVASLSPAPVPAVADPGAAAARPAVTDQATAAPVQAVSAPAPGTAPDPGFAVWLRSEVVPASSPVEPLAASCTTCPPNKPFCCPQPNGCCACTSRPVVCAPS